MIVGLDPTFFLKELIMDFNKETALVETVLFLESEPLTVKMLSNRAQLSEEVVEKCLEKLNEKYSAEDSGIEISTIAGGLCLTPKKEYWDVLKELYGMKREGRLSKSAMETLAIIAYKQPVTRAEIEAIRGVGVDNMVRLLIERNLIKEVGKKDAPGRPTLFGTTKEFLKLFRLNSIADLPKLDEDEEERFELAR
jgi:segregation and condensation protein B